MQSTFLNQGRPTSDELPHRRQSLTGPTVPGTGFRVMLAALRAGVSSRVHIAVGEVQ